MTTMVVVTVPDGVYEGQEFTLEFEGQQLAVCCPDGCGPGSEINLEVPIATGTSGAAPPSNMVDVVVPDGCFPGTEFTVDFDGRHFNITVPDGTNPGETLTVEVPAAEEPAPQIADPPAETQPQPQPTSKPQKPQKMNLEIPAFRGGGGGGSQQDSKRESLSKSKYLDGLDIPPYRGPMKGVTQNSMNAHAKWVPATSLFDMNPDQGYGRQAGDFQIGQLVQVLRSNGSWTCASAALDPSTSVSSRASPERSPRSSRRIVSRSLRR